MYETMHNVQRQRITTNYEIYLFLYLQILSIFLAVNLLSKLVLKESMLCRYSYGIKINSNWFVYNVIAIKLTHNVVPLYFL